MINDLAMSDRTTDLAMKSGISLDGVSQKRPSVSRRVAETRDELPKEASDVA